MWHQLLGTWEIVETEEHHESCFWKNTEVLPTPFCLLSYKEVALFTATYRPGDIVYEKVTCVDMHSFVDKLYYFVESG